MVWVRGDLSQLGHDVFDLRQLPEHAHLLVDDWLEAGDKRAVPVPLCRHGPPHARALPLLEVTKLPVQLLEARVDETLHARVDRGPVALVELLAETNHLVGLLLDVRALLLEF
jgi:hypothetical protein